MWELFLLSFRFRTSFLKHGRLDERSDIGTDVFLTASTSIHRPNRLTKNPGLDVFFEGPEFFSKLGCFKVWLFIFCWGLSFCKGSILCRRLLLVY